jgi:hypothetical protein
MVQKNLRELQAEFNIHENEAKKNKTHNRQVGVGDYIRVDVSRWQQFQVSGCKKLFRRVQQA